MDFTAYQQMAYVTANHKLEPEQEIIDAALGMCSEAGEFAGLLKKAYYQGHDFDEEKFKDELGDVLWYVALAASALNIDLNTVALNNLQKLAKRYPDKFSPERSMNRES